MAISEIFKHKSRDFFLLGARLTFGIWLFYLGLMKWINGPTGFVGYIEGAFAEAWIPGFLIVITAWVILIAELLLGLWLLIGKHIQKAWCGVILLMLLLVMGKTVEGQFDVVANNWQYLILALVCASLSSDGK